MKIHPGLIELTDRGLMRSRDQGFMHYPGAGESGGIFENLPRPVGIYGLGFRGRGRADRITNVEKIVVSVDVSVIGQPRRTAAEYRIDLINIADVRLRCNAHANA